ncbi:cytochrome c biogenesis protein CcsA [Candidatus Bathyarchaeota archaeon]|nr:cytochrome c biogenesis protein CcsA [Candidatus Bathyarchaeota archaeon]
MIIGYLLLQAASLLLLLDIYTLSRSGSTLRDSRRGLAAFVTAALCVLAAFLIYLNSFLCNNFSLRDVYAYNSIDLAIMYKLYASWASAGGSMLLWSTIFSSIYVFYRVQGHGSSERDESKCYMHLNILLILLLAATILADPFARLSFDAGGGLGLNPLLQSPWMAIHPPIIFLAYTLPFFPLAFSFTSLSRGEESYAGSIRLFMQLSWLFFTLGIALGGVWAYEVLGWGGYWSWDPVETASLLPWLTVTAYFHTTAMTDRGKSLIREFSVLVTALLVVFATMITRSGALVSVHAFEASIAGVTLPFIIMLLYIAGYFIYLRGKVNRPIFTFPKGHSKNSVLLTIAYITLLYMTGVCLLGVSLPALHSIQLGTTYSLGKEFYNTWLLPPTLLFIVTLVFCSIPRRVSFKASLAVIMITVSTAVLSVILRSPTTNQFANFGLPFLAVALISTLCSLAYATVNLRKLRLIAFGRALVHTSLVLILLGVFLSSSMETYDQGLLGVGDTLHGIGFELTVTGASLSGPHGSIHTQNGTLPEHSSLELDVAASYGNSRSGGRLWTGLYTVYGLVSRPLILRDGLNDIYVSVGFTDSLYRVLLLQLASTEQPQLSEFTIQVRVIPYVNLIWAGVALFTLGNIILIIAGLRRNRSIF